MESKNLEVLVIPSFGITVMTAEMEMTRLLASRIGVVVLLANASKWEDEAMKGEPGVTMIRLPALPEVAGVPFPLFDITTQMEAYKPVVKDIIRKRLSSGERRRLAGFVMSMFCTPMVDVADDLGVPSYFMAAASASAMAFHFHFQGPLGGRLPESPTLELPGFRNPLPEKAWPAVLKNKAAAPFFAKHMTRIRSSKGLLLNTFKELEPDILASFLGDTTLPPVFPIGPIVHPVSPGTSPLIGWLDLQPPRSVVLLSFGPLGAFSADQVREIAAGLEKSGHRFLWALKKQAGPWEGRDYDDFNEVLPEGFLERTSSVGRVVSFVPQGEVLAHEALGAFVSHCAWNSMLESLLSGVPVAAWPLFAEQHISAYYWACEAGLATEITMDSLYDATPPGDGDLVKAAQVELGIRRAMEDAAVRNRVEELSIVGKNALLHGGSSHHSLTLFTDQIIHNVSSST